MRSVAALCALCLVAVFASTNGRVTLQDSSVSGGPGFAFTTSSDDWQDISTSSYPVSPARFSSVFRLNDIVDAIFDSMTPRPFSDGSADRVFTRVSTPDPFRTGTFVTSDAGIERDSLLGQDGWEEVPQVVRKVSTEDLFRQLSLARFAAPRLRGYRVYVMTEDDASEPSMEQLLSALTEQDFEAASSLDSGLLEDESLSNPDGAYATVPDEDSSPRITLDFSGLPDGDEVSEYYYDDSYDPVVDTIADGVGAFEQGVDAFELDDWHYATDDVSGDWQYDADEDFATDEDFSYSYDGVDASYSTYDVDFGDSYGVPGDAFGPSDAATSDLHITYDDARMAWRSQLEGAAVGSYPTDDGVRFDPPVFVRRPDLEQSTQSAPPPWHLIRCGTVTSYPPGEAFMTYPTNFGADASWVYNWGTLALCVACAFVWAAVAVEFHRVERYTRELNARAPSSDPLAQPLLLESRAVLPAEFDGVESADIYRAYSLKVQHAREHTVDAPDASEDALKAHFG